MDKLGNFIKAVREINELNQDELADLTHVSQSSIAGYEKGRSNPKPQFVKRFKELFGYDLSESDITNVIPVKTYDKSTGHKISYRQQLKEKKLNHNQAAIPIFEVAPQTLSNIESYRDEKTTAPDFWITIPDLKDYNYGFRAKGDSMHPLIRNRGLVIAKEITDISVIIFGEVYIIHTTNGLETVKYIHPHEDDPEMLLLVPLNEKAKTTPVHKSEILRLYEARAVFNPL